MAWISTESDSRDLGRTESLSPEILLDILSKLDSHQIVVTRRTCKKWLDAIDNNTTFWKTLVWIQKDDEESALPALEMFDEKSGSALKKVSISQTSGKPNDPRLVQEGDLDLFPILQRSKDSLEDLSFRMVNTHTARNPIMDLAASSTSLESLVFWTPSSVWRSDFPRTRLVRASRRYNQEDAPPSSKLRLLWLSTGEIEKWIEKLDASSIVSLADAEAASPMRLYQLINPIASNLIHLSISLGAHSSPPPSLSCPSLQIFEGEFGFPIEFPPWLQCPILRVAIARLANSVFIQGLPISVEELWLLRWSGPRMVSNLDDLLQVCPLLKALKLGRELLETLGVASVLETLRKREENVGQGFEIKGIKMSSIERLIVPTELLTSAQLVGLKESVGEVIDDRDYPDFIELEF